jgi:WD40 repeat protein
VLQKRVRELTARVKTLSIENESLKAECEIYRQEAALPNFSNLALGRGGGDGAASEQQLLQQLTMNDPFVRSGNGIYPQDNPVTLTNLHDHSNHLTCALSPDDDAILASSGADATVRLVPWGLVVSSDNNNNNNNQDAALVAGAVISCQAPAVTIAFSPVLRGVLAAGCMDGSVVLIHYELTTCMDTTSSRRLETTTLALEKKHVKYVRTVAWSHKEPILATSSADGCIYLYRVRLGGFDMTELSVEFMESLHLQGPIESMCFSENNQLICHVRGTPFLFYFDLNKNLAQSKINLNTTTAAENVAGGGCDSHVSFTLMDLKPFQDKYLAAATDTSRNMILDLATGRQIRNLYGHTNDLYSHPKVAWSSNGQYLLGNTQNEGIVCVWDIASSQIVNRLQPTAASTVMPTTGGGTTIRDMFSSRTTDILVTTSFDKTTRLWFAPAASSSSNDVPSSMSM